MADSHFMEYGYHCTVGNHLNSINKEGLKLNDEGIIWFSKNPFDYPPMSYCNGVLLRFPLTVKYQLEENGGSIDSDEFITWSSIPSNNIEVLTMNKQWEKLCHFVQHEMKPFQVVELEEFDFSTQV